MNIRWYNEKTQEFSWEDPKAKSHWKPIEEGGKTYYYNLVTGESQVAGGGGRGGEETGQDFAVASL